jgi:hypothetical protein
MKHAPKTKNCVEIRELVLERELQRDRSWCARASDDDNTAPVFSFFLFFLLA